MLMWFGCREERASTPTPLRVCEWCYLDIEGLLDPEDEQDAHADWRAADGQVVHGNRRHSIVRRPMRRPIAPYDRTEWVPRAAAAAAARGGNPSAGPPHRRIGRSAQAIVPDETDVILPALEIPEHIAEAAE